MAIETYIRNIFSSNRLAYKNANQHISNDKSWFIHHSCEQVWLVGLINLETNKIRLEG